MTGKMVKMGVLLGLAALIGGSTASAIKSPEALRILEHQRRQQRNGATERAKTLLDANTLKLADHPTDGPVLDPMLSTVVNDVRRGGSLLGAMDVDTIASVGIPVGITTYDYQHNESNGHQIARNPGGNTVHITWMYWDRIPLDIDAETDRFVRYNSYDVGTASFNQGFDGCAVSLGDFARAGYTRMDVGTDTGSNLGNIFMHQRAAADLDYSTWYLQFPLEGSCLHLDQELASGGLGEILWPDGAIQQDPGGDIRHVIAHDGNDDSRNLVAYWQYDEGGAATWVGPAIIDSTNILGYVIDAEDAGTKVAIAYHSDFTHDGLSNMRQIVYRESVTNGLGWISGAELGPLNKNFVTGYNDPAAEEAWLHISVAYDHAGVLHIVWDEQRVAGQTEDVAIRHWNNSRNTIRPAAIGYYENDGITTFNLNLAKVTMGIGDGSTNCQGGAETNEDYVYVTYTKQCGETLAEQEDVSKLGYCNGEIYLTASNTGGETWSPPQNLTNTKLPQCTVEVPDSVCPSEHWATIGRDVGEAIDIFYIRDYDAGGVPQGEGPWTINDAMYLRYPGGTTDAEFVCPLIAPNIATFVTNDPDCEYNAPPNMTNDETLTVINLGNAGLSGNIAVTSGGAWLSVSGAAAYAIAAGGADDVRTVTMGPQAVEGLYQGNIEVTHNDTSKASPINFPIDFFVVDGFKCPEREILKTAVASPGILALEMGTDGRFANQNSESGLWRHEDSSLTIYDGTLLLAHGAQGPDTVVYHRFYNRTDPGQRGFRALTNLEVDTSTYGTGSGYALGKGEMTTLDSTISIWVEWFYPQGGVYGDFIVAKYTVANRTASPLTDVTVGIWADLDETAASHIVGIQDGVGNHGNFVSPQNLLYQYGYDSIGHVPASHDNSSQRYSGGITYMHGRDATGAAFSYAQAPLRGAVDDNRDNQTGGGPSSGLLYSKLVGTPGVTVWEGFPHADSAKDQYTWLTLDQGRALAAAGSAGDAEVYIVAWLSDTLQHPAYALPSKALAGGLSEVADSAWSWAGINVDTNPTTGCVCACHTDPQCDGVTNVLDVVKTVNVAFRGIPPVFDADCPRQRSDVDCSGFSNVLDVVKVVNVAFRGLPAASQFCDGCS